jgi:hypothetical protein
MMTSEFEAALEVLREAFIVDHAECERAASLPSETPARTCRYCGVYWHPFPGSKLDGHANCIVSERFKRRVAAALRCQPRMTYANVGKAIGVSKGVVRAWCLHLQRMAA